MKFITNKNEDKTCIIQKGMRFNTPAGETYILAHIEGVVLDEQRFCLISLEDGNRWAEPATLEEIADQLNKNNFKLLKTKVGN